jgi:hypothetical protein
MEYFVNIHIKYITQYILNLKKILLRINVSIN